MTHKICSQHPTEQPKGITRNNATNAAQQLLNAIHRNIVVCAIKMLRTFTQVASIIWIIHAQNGEKGRFAFKNMRCVPKAVRMAQKMGEGLGQCPFLFGPVPPGALTLR